MTQQVFFDGPQPPQGRVWCAVCAGGYKHAGVAAQRDAINRAQNGNGTPSGKAPRFTLGKPLMSSVGPLDGAELALAVTRGLSTLGPNFGVLDVCWSHLIALDMTGGAIAPASPQEAAMFSQAAQLGRQRGQG